MDEFEYFSGSKKSIIKTENQKVPRPNKISLKFCFSKVIGRKLLKYSSKTGVIQDEIMKKGNPAKENIYVSVCQHKGEHFDEHIYEDLCESSVPSPDYELFDGDVQFMYYNDAFFC